MPDPTTQPDPEQEQEAIWVKSDVLPDGSYCTTVEFDEDLTLALLPPAAQAYANALLAVAAAGEYDAALFNQYTKALKAEPEVAAEMVRGQRQDRRPVDVAAFAPMVVEPGIADRDGTFVAFFRCQAGTREWQWNMADVVQHVTHLLTTPIVADLDQAYRRHLLHVVGLEDPLVRRMVDDLRNHRPDRDL